MHFSELRLENLRSVRAAELDLAPGVNLITGANGAGKTTVLEAAYLLSHGHSFRAGRKSALGTVDGGHPAVFGRLERPCGGLPIGIGWDGRRWVGRVAGETVAALADLVRSVAVSCFEPGSHALISGPSDERRSFMDWGLFHVEPEFYGVWRRASRSLLQRNALLKANGGVAELLVWEHELSVAGERLSNFRRQYLDRWTQPLTRYLERFLPELGAPTLEFRPGWEDSESLASCLLMSRARDQIRGHTGVGPHRADWRIAFRAAPLREHLSRGQEKLCALACVLSQAELFSKDMGEWPVICLDDLGSELDQGHLGAVLDELGGGSAQVLITATEASTPLAKAAQHGRRFHVEQGQVTALI